MGQHLPDPGSSYLSSAMMKSNNVDFLGQIEELKSVTSKSNTYTNPVLKDEISI